MTNSPNSITELLKHLQQSEERLLEDVTAMQDRLHTTAAKLLFTDMRLAIAMHTQIYKELLNVIKDPPPENLWDARIETYVDTLAMRKELEKHMETEDATLKQIEKAVAVTKDEAIRILLTHIANDIEEHHKTIELILKRSYILDT